MPTIADLLGVIDRFKRNPWESAQDYARGVARSIPEAGASIIDALPRRPGMGSTTEWLNQRLLGTPLEAKGTNTEGAGGLLGFPGAGTALKGGAAALGKLGGLLGAGVMTYHGTPHKFDKFDLSKIGTGEGAQAYGHGMYFAENPATAANYFRGLGGDYAPIENFKVGWKNVGPHNQFDYSPKGSSSIENIRASVIEDALIDENALVGAMAKGSKGVQEHVLKLLDERIKRFPEEWPEGLPAAQALRKELARPGAVDLKMGQQTGAIYKQDLPDEKLPHMLQWDKPLKDQPTALKGLLRDQLKARGYLGQNDNGPRQVNSAFKAYKMEQGGMAESDVETVLGMLGQNKPPNVPAQEWAAEQLRKAGIPGLSYLDQISRDVGKGTKNHVVWDQALLDLMRPQRAE